MKIRLSLAAVLAAGLAFSVSGAEAATPVMDGKKVKVLTKKVAAGNTQNMADFALGFEEETCEDPKHCPTLKFVYNPAKGVKGGLMFTASWTNMASDFDLYILEYDKRGNAISKAHCGGSAFTKERVYLGPTDLKKGTTYGLMVNLFRSVGDTVTSKVEIGVPNTIPTTVPAQADELAYVNCTL